MWIGAMNNPENDLHSEIEWMSSANLDFIDLTLEPPRAASWSIDVRALRTLLEKKQLKVVGHTAYYLPVSSPFESLRKAAVQELLHCLKVFHELGATGMNLHPQRYAPFHERAFIIERNLQTIRDLLPTSEKLGVPIMVENIPGDFNDAEQLADLLDPLPQLGLHLDIGHANLMVEENTTGEILQRFGPRLKHVHLHDNKGGTADLHLPLGTGTVDVAQSIRCLHRAGYDGTITLEVFSPDKHHFEYSRDLLRKTWNEAIARERGKSLHTNLPVDARQKSQFQAPATAGKRE
jgi:sugar phosphate isomerase/epimerase